MNGPHSAPDPLIPPASAVAKPAAPVRLAGRRHYGEVGLLFLFALVYRFFGDISYTLLLFYATAIVAVALNAVVSRVPVRRRWVTILMALLIVGTIVAGLWFGVPLLVEQLRGLSARAPEMEARLREWEGWLRANTGLNVHLLGPEAQEYLRDTFLSTGRGGSLLGRAEGLLGTLVIPVFVLVGGLFAAGSPNRHLLDAVLRAAPRSLRPAVRRILELLAVRILGWLKGTLVGMVAVGVLSGVLYALIGVPNALLLGIFAGLTEFIPLVGPFIGGGVASVVAFLDEPSKGLWAALAALAVQQFENQVIIPMAMSRTADVHPVVTIFALILFGKIFGFLGVLLAIPLVLFLWTVTEVLWVERTIDTDQDEIPPVVED